MKRSILAVAAVLALGSASAFAQTAGVQPSFNDAPDLTPIPITGTQMVDQHLPKGSFNSGGPRGPATMVVQGNQSNASYANSTVGGTSSDASSGASSSRGFGAGSAAHEPAETLNDSFHYPAY
jgi:hypothetical protein